MIVWLIILCASTVLFVHTSTVYIHNAYILHTYEPTQDYAILLDLHQRLIEVEELLGMAEVYEVTAYTDSCGTGDGYTATMTTPEVGRTIAVDPRVIPLGSKVWIEGEGVHVAEDTGGAIKGNIIDLYVGESRATAFRWGRQERMAIVLD